MMGELKQFRKGKTKWLSNVACDDFSVCTIRIITKNLNHLNLCNNVRFCKHHCSCNITVYSFYCFLLQYASDCTKYTVTVSIQLYTLFHCIISFIWWIICILFTLFLIYHHFYHFIETFFSRWKDKERQNTTTLKWKMIGKLFKMTGKEFVQE